MSDLTLTENAANAFYGLLQSAEITAAPANVMGAAAPAPKPGAPAPR